MVMCKIDRIWGLGGGPKIVLYVISGNFLVYDLDLSENQGLQWTATSLS